MVKRPDRWKGTLQSDSVAAKAALLGKFVKLGDIRLLLHEIKLKISAQPPELPEKISS